MPPSSCTMTKLPTDYLVFDNCQSVEKVEREECSGYCPSIYKNQLMVSDKIFIKPSFCKCCQAAETYNQTVSIRCIDQNQQYTVYNATYQRITSCGCQNCQ